MENGATMRPSISCPPRVVEHSRGRGYQPITEADSVAHTILTPEESKVDDVTRERLYSTLPLRFWERTEQTETCWLYHKLSPGRKYGRYSWEGKAIAVHRLVWTLVHGEIPPNMLVCHKCDNPPCFNPSHLFLGTWKDNAWDMFQKGRNSPHVQLKLTMEQVREIKIALAENATCVELGKRYGVDQHTIDSIRTGATWRHLVVGYGVPQEELTVCWSTRNPRRAARATSLIHLKNTGNTTTCGIVMDAAWDMEMQENDRNITCATCRRIARLRNVYATSQLSIDSNRDGLRERLDVIATELNEYAYGKTGDGSRYPEWEEIAVAFGALERAAQRMTDCQRQAALRGTEAGETGEGKRENHR